MVKLTCNMTPDPSLTNSKCDQLESFLSKTFRDLLSNSPINPLKSAGNLKLKFDLISFHYQAWIVITICTSHGIKMPTFV